MLFNHKPIGARKENDLLCLFEIIIIIIFGVLSNANTCCRCCCCCWPDKWYFIWPNLFRIIFSWRMVANIFEKILLKTNSLEYDPKSLVIDNNYLHTLVDFEKKLRFFLFINYCLHISWRDTKQYLPVSYTVRYRLSLIFLLTKQDQLWEWTIKGK